MKMAVLLQCVLWLLFCTDLYAGTAADEALLPFSAKSILKPLNASLFSSKILPNISFHCLNATVNVIEHGKVLGKYIDALGKPGSGFMLGNQILYGSYQECKQLPDSHFCTTSFSLSTGNTTPSVSPVIGMCVPHSCGEEDVFIILELILKVTPFLKQYITRLPTFDATYGSPVVCQDQKKQLPTGSVVMIIVSAIFLILALIGTVVDLAMPEMFKKLQKQSSFQRVPSVLQAEADNADANSSEPLVSKGDEQTNNLQEPISLLLGASYRTSGRLLGFILCFSMEKNIKTILNTSVPRGAIESLNGLRTLSMWWVILGHTYAFTILLTDDIVLELTIFQRFTSLPIVNGFFSVDSFFFLSGLLVSYLTLRRVTSKGGFPWVKYYLHRFLRLTPTMMFVILFTMYIYPLLGSGPLWFEQSTLAKSCKKYWWTNLIYINNFYPEFRISCIDWTWYLANDMQFYVISPVVIIAMARLKGWGAVFSTGILLVSSFVATALLIDHYNLMTDFASKSSLYDKNSLFMFLRYVYTKPYCRIAPYLVGLLLGYILFNSMVPRMRLRKIFMYCGWLLCLTVGMATIWGNWGDFKTGGTPMTHVGSVFYGTFSRFSWGCFLAWIVYACHNGYGGLIGRFLSWRAFIPLSRLTYSAYLIHPLVMNFYIYSNQKGLHYTDVNTAYLFASFVTLSYACAFILAVVVEFPLMNVERLIFQMG